MKGRKRIYLKFVAERNVKICTVAEYSLMRKAPKPSHQTLKVKHGSCEHAYLKDLLFPLGA
jgi:hypothetical protein